METIQPIAAPQAIIPGASWPGLEPWISTTGLEISRYDQQKKRRIARRAVLELQEHRHARRRGPASTQPQCCEFAARMASKETSKRRRSRTPRKAIRQRKTEKSG